MSWLPGNAGDSPWLLCERHDEERCLPRLVLLPCPTIQCTNLIQTCIILPKFKRGINTFVKPRGHCILFGKDLVGFGFIWGQLRS